MEAKMFDGMLMEEIVREYKEEGVHQGNCISLEDFVGMLESLVPEWREMYAMEVDEVEWLYYKQ